VSTKANTNNKDPGPTHQDEVRSEPNTRRD
jgi:hypothetical protein